MTTFLVLDEPCADDESPHGELLPVNRPLPEGVHMAGPWPASAKLTAEMEHWDHRFEGDWTHAPINWDELRIRQIPDIHQTPGQRTRDPERLADAIELLNQCRLPSYDPPSRDAAVARVRALALLNLESERAIGSSTCTWRVFDGVAMVLVENFRAHADDCLRGTPFDPVRHPRA